MLLGELFAKGEEFIIPQGFPTVIDSLPLPVCKRVRARVLQEAQEQGLLWLLCCQEREVRLCPKRGIGWRLHLVCTPAGIPVSFALPEASHQHRGGDSAPAHWPAM